MKPAFPATYSTLCPTALSSLISEKYEVGNVHCKFLVRGVGDTYLVESSEARFILRVYRSSHRSLPQIKEEVKLLRALKQADVAVSYPIPNSSGEAILTLEAAEGVRHAVLFSYAPGHVARSLNENQLRALGHEMARFHNVSSNLSLGGERWSFDLETTVFKPLEKLKPLFAEDAEGYACCGRWPGKQKGNCHNFPHQGSRKASVILIFFPKTSISIMTQLPFSTLILWVTAGW